MRKRRSLLALAAIVAVLLVAFQPFTATHFGYALPLPNGLPCRIHLGGRDYDNDELCTGMNRGSWAVWYDARHHIPSGGLCVTLADLRKQKLLPLHQIGSVSTLLGLAHPMMSPDSVDSHKGALTAFFVVDGRCYRPYGLSGGP